MCRNRRSKYTLEWNLAGEEKIQHARNEPRPIGQLVRQLVALDPARIIIESTGGRLLLRLGSLAAAEEGIGHRLP